MKSLRIIQILAKVAKIICTVVFICCIVGASICALSLILLPILRDTTIYDGKTVTVLLADKSVSLSSAITASAFGLVSAGVGIFLAKYSELFFKKELEVGTPFKKEIVKDMRKLAIIHIVVSLATTMVLATIYAIVKASAKELIDFNPHQGGSVGFGISLLIISLFCEYGAEKEENEKVTDSKE